MPNIELRVRYVDGTTVQGGPTLWTVWPGQGVDSVQATTCIGTTEINGQSVYWCYTEGANWVVGGGPVGYGTIPPEVLLTETGAHEPRLCRFMPDLPLTAVKLGHWWPGTSEPVWP